MTERTPPQDLDAERAALGGMLMSKTAVDDVLAVLTGHDFYLPAHELVFYALSDLYVDGRPADPVAVATELARRGELAKVGGAPYLHDLMNAVPTAASAGYYAVKVRESAVLRRVVEAGTRIAQMGYSTDGADVAAIVDRAQAETHALSERRRDDEAEPTPADSVARVLQSLETPSAVGLPTGLHDLDHLTGGLHAGQMVIVAARPSIGKSTLGCDFLRHASVKLGRPAALFSLEMGRDEVTTRMLSAEGKIPLHHLRYGEMQDADWGKLADCHDRVSNAPLHVDDAPDLSLMRIRTKARRLKQRGGLDLVVVDYLQLMNAGGRRAESRQQEVSEMSRGLKLLAKELHVPVVAIAQLNRGPEQRADKRPMLSDLRESGSLEQDADVVVLLHREDAYERESPRAGEADLIVAKHRNGATATITCAFQGHYSRFVDMAAS